MKVIMYHYVREFNPLMPNFKHLHFEDFCKQLDHFQAEYNFVSKEDFIDSFHSNHPLPKGVILTFDDGLSCHYNYVFKELKRRNLWGIFYVPTQPYMQGKFIDVHKVHMLLGMFNGEEILKSLLGIINDDKINHEYREKFETLVYKHQDNDANALLVKQILNYFIKNEFKSIVVDQLFSIYIADQSLLLENFYIKPHQLKEMNEAGMIIGSHTITHPVLSKLSSKEQLSEIKDSFDCLENMSGDLGTKTFCFPYGGFHSFNDDTIEILETENVHFSFNVEHRDIVKNDLKYQKQYLPRYDCNQFLFGQVRK
jgi:peptidoglycan/xylan/chitin deacetylase (PgdA/CDA1 family)